MHLPQQHFSSRPAARSRRSDHRRASTPRPSPTFELTWALILALAKNVTIDDSPVRRTFLETAVVRGDTAFRACEWPCAKVDDPPDGFLGYEELERGCPPVCVRWLGSAHYPDGALFYDAQTLGLRTDANGWVELRELTRELDDKIYQHALRGAKNEPAATDRINRRRQLAAYYVEQIKLVALEQTPDVADDERR